MYVARQRLIQPRVEEGVRDPGDTLVACTQAVWSRDYRICVAMFFLHCLEAKRRKQNVEAKTSKMTTVPPQFIGREPRFSLSSSLFLPPSLFPAFAFTFYMLLKMAKTITKTHQILCTSVQLLVSRVRWEDKNTQHNARATEETRLRTQHTPGRSSVNHLSRHRPRLRLRHTPHEQYTPS